MPKPWTSQQDAVLTHAWTNGVLVKQIAAMTGHSVFSVKSRRADIGLPKRVPIKKLSARYHFRMTPQMKKAMQQRAKQLGLWPATYVMSLVAADLENANGRNLIAHPVPPAQLGRGDRSGDRRHIAETGHQG